MSLPSLTVCALIAYGGFACKIAGASSLSLGTRLLLDALWTHCVPPVEVRWGGRMASNWLESCKPPCPQQQLLFVYRRCEPSIFTKHANTTMKRVPILMGCWMQLGICLLTSF